MKPTWPVVSVWVPPHASTSQSAMLTILRVLEGTTPPWKSLNPYFASASFLGSYEIVDREVLHDHVVGDVLDLPDLLVGELGEVGDVEPAVVLLLEAECCQTHGPSTCLDAPLRMWVAVWMRRIFCLRLASTFPTTFEPSRASAPSSLWTHDRAYLLDVEDFFPR